MSASRRGEQTAVGAGGAPWSRVPPVLVGPGRVIADDVVYVLDASLPRGTTITAGEPYESRGEWRLWQGDEVLVSPDVLAALLVRPSPEPPAAGQLYVEDACLLLRVSRSTLDSRIKECPEQQQPMRWGGGKGAGRRRRWYWSDEAELRTWWARFGGPAPVTKATLRPPRARAAKPAEGDTADWNAVRREYRKK
jgi:hypothetical protein